MQRLEESVEPDVLASSHRHLQTFCPPWRVLRGMFRVPLLAWRMGLGTLVGHRFVLITMRGQQGGLLRRVVLEYGALRGKLYVMSGFGTQPDWYKDLCADPYVMVQTWQGPESMQAHCVTDDAEIRDVCALFMRQNAVGFRRHLLSSSTGSDSIDEVLAHKGRLALLRFDPTDEAVPLPLEADLVWVWPLLATVLGGLAWVLQRRYKRDED